MTMKELETDILNSLQELADPISQYSFLIACAGACPAFPEELRTEDHLVRECQVNTWVRITAEDGTVRFQMDSEALIVKGALALLVELYNGRSLQEVRGFTCHLISCEDFTRHFNAEQRKGLSAIIQKIGGL